MRKTERRVSVCKEKSTRKKPGQKAKELINSNILFDFSDTKRESCGFKRSAEITLQSVLRLVKKFLLHGY